MKHVIIINPTAGVKNQIDKIKKLVDEAFYDKDYEIYVTKAPRDAHNYVLNYDKSDYVRFYACGGDGTLNEIASGLVGAQNADVACYPIGSGNDFMKYFGKKEHFLNFKNLINGESTKIDVIKYNDEYAINIFNIGFDAKVVVSQRRIKKFPLMTGKSAYNLGVFTNLLKKMNYKVKIKVDGEEVYQGKMLLCAIANAKCYGGGYYCAPKADVADGILDLCAIKKISRLKLASLIKFYKAGKHLDNPKLEKYVVYHTGREFELEIEKPLYYSKDGESGKSSLYKINVIPKCVNFVVPKIDTI